MNQKYAAIFLAAIMVMSVFSYFVASFIGNSGDDEGTTGLEDAPGFETIGGTHFSADLNSVSDGLAFSPDGMEYAIYEDYSKTYGTPLQSYNVSDLYLYYNTMTVQRFSAYNITGNYGFEAHVLNPEIVNFNYTISDTYNGYSLLFRGSDIYSVIGTPALISDLDTIEDVIDVASGTSPASDDFTEILSYVDPGAEYQIVTSTDPLADQHYIEYRNMYDGNYSKTEIFLNPLESTVETVNSMEANSSSKNLVYDTTLTDDGRILKVVVETNATNFINLVTEQYY